MHFLLNLLGGNFSGWLRTAKKWTNKPIKKTVLFQTNSKEVYKERATGDVKVDIQDEKLNKLVKSIQEIIKAKNDAWTNH